MAHNPNHPYQQDSAQSRGSYGDPFGDGNHGAPQIHFQEPQRPPRGSPQLRPFESSTTLPHEFGGQHDDYDEEKLPLTNNQDFVGGLYPPGYVFSRFLPFHTLPCVHTS